jgi:ribosome biogenesis protein Nip4
MSELEKFTENFTGKKIDCLQLRNGFYLNNPDLAKIKAGINQEPFSAGLFLGEIRKNMFVPGTPLLDMISKTSDRKIFVNRKTAWLFLCGRDIFGSGIVKANVENGMVLVQNELDENLGYGEIVADLSLKDKVVVENLFDKGDFLRRERSR